MNKNTEKLLEIIKKLCGEQGFTLETNKFLAEELNVSVKTISRMFTHLKEAGQIICSRMDNKRMIKINDGNERIRIDKMTNEELQQDINNLSVIPVWQVNTIIEFLNDTENNLNPVLITRLIRLFGFRVVLQALDEYLETTENVVERNFRSYMDEKYIKFVDAKKIREDVKAKFS